MMKEIKVTLENDSEITYYYNGLKHPTILMDNLKNIRYTIREKEGEQIKITAMADTKAEPHMGINWECILSTCTASRKNLRHM